MRALGTMLLTVVAALGACGGARAAAKPEVPFQRGVNLTSWLQVGSARRTIRQRTILSRKYRSAANGGS
jgi:hypothetical protein